MVHIKAVLPNCLKMEKKKSVVRQCSCLKTTQNYFYFFIDSLSFIYLFIDLLY